ncbi:MAG: hypothetical protein HDR54_02890 [Treponema sp.]|nr:hypothetical protein [Treponema sp.]
MNYYCIFTQTGMEDRFKAAAKKILDEGEADLSGEILIFKQVKKIVKLNRVYDEIIFPGYVFFKTEESDPRKFRTFMKIDGFIKFLPETSKILALAGRDLEIVTLLEKGGEIQGFVRAKFDKNDRIVIVSGPFSGINGTVISVNRRNQKLQYGITTESGVCILNLSYFDMEKQDWTQEESSYIASMKTTD